MADPELLVDQRDEPQNLLAAALGHLEIERAGDMQRLHVLDPGERHVIFCPAPAHGDRHLVRRRPVEDPFAEGCEPLDDVERMFHAIYLDLQSEAFQSTRPVPENLISISGNVISIKSFETPR